MSSVHSAARSDEPEKCLLPRLYRFCLQEYNFRSPRALYPAPAQDAIALMTHDDDTEYMDYVRAIKPNPIAKAVKLADLNHNSDLSRLDVVDEQALKRREKYLKAIELLEN